MPELPEVETVKVSLEPKIQEKTITSITISDTVKQSKAEKKEAIVKGQSVSFFEKTLQGMKIISLTRYGKYLVFSLEKDTTPYYLVNHLGMTGAWFVVQSLDDIAEEKYKRNIHATFTLDSGEMLIYSDQRRFGEMRFLEEETFKAFKPIQNMGPEPLKDEAFAPFYSNITNIKNQEKSIKEVLLDQGIISGVGNIYACEALFLSNLHPATPLKKITKAKYKEIFGHVKDLLLYSISVGGASISDYVDADGKRGSFQNTMHVYGLETCGTCGSTIDNIKIKTRSSFYCPKCQK